VVNDSLGNLRNYLAKKLKLIKEGTFEFTWVVDFPLLDFDEDLQRHVAIHHPFTSPKDDQVDKLDSDPGNVLSKAYDLTLNGVELGGGSIRIHQREIQEKVFKGYRIKWEEAEEN